MRCLASTLRTSVGVLFGMIVSGAGADLAAQSCNIDPNSPKELGIVSITFQRARGMPAGEGRVAAIRGVIAELEKKPERFSKNPVGYNYVMAQAISLASLEPSIGLNPTRGQLGFVTTPDQAFDLTASLSTLYDEMAMTPGCAADVTEMRQGDVWLAFTRRALEASNSGQLDSASIYANRSIKLSAASPYPHHVLAVVANARNDRMAAIEHWNKVIELAGADSSLSELKMQSQYYVAMSELDQARSAQGDGKRAAAQRAATAIKAFMVSSPKGSDVSVSMNALAEAYVMSGDTAQIPGIYKTMLDAPANFDDNVLTMGGVIATQVGRVDDARVLFEAAIAKNPFARDALRNLAATYHTKELFREMYKPLDVLKTIDPNNVDAWLMYAYSAQGQLKAAKTPADKKAWTDSLVKYSNAADSLKAKVEVAGFARSSEMAELELSVEQAAEGSGSYTVDVEFLDTKGAVVTRESKQVGPIAKGAKASVKLQGKGVGIVAYRYKPLK